MCGIAGFFNFSGESIDRSALTGMSNEIAHRGPDGRGEFVDEDFGLAHRRLAILDLSENGSQPMKSKDSKWVIAFNGCIYNFQSLKAELELEGCQFSSKSDTEVIVEGIAKRGVDFIKSLNGMFAIVAFNLERRELYLLRDRYGVKPLYYLCDDDKIIFASEIKAIIRHPKVSANLDKGALNEYFSFQNLFSYRTLFKDIFLVPPANSIKVSKSHNKVVHNNWWDFDFSNSDSQLDFRDSISLTKEHFESAVKGQLISDVPVGSYLSGGMDSGSIASIASTLLPKMATFTCGFDMNNITGVESNFDERRDAEILASNFQTEHYEQIISAKDLSWALPRVIYHLEDLKVGMTYPNFYISRLASKFVKVCLQGTGGDELFGGYPWRYYKVFHSLDQAEFFENYYAFWQRLVSDKEKRNLFHSHVFQDIDETEPRKIFERVFTFNEGLRYNNPYDHINNSLYFECKTFLPGLLMVGDKLSMANGLEERFPFLDNDLVQIAQKIPVEHKLANLGKNLSAIDENEFKAIKIAQSHTLYNEGKNVLRKAMKDYIPQVVLDRKKQGFSAPDENWYRGENANYVKELLLKRNAACSEFIQRNYIEKVLDEHLNKHINHRLLIWSLISFEWWCRIYLRGDSFE